MISRLHIPRVGTSIVIPPPIIFHVMLHSHSHYQKTQRIIRLKAENMKANVEKYFSNPFVFPSKSHLKLMFIMKNRRPWRWNVSKTRKNKHKIVKVVRKSRYKLELFLRTFGWKWRAQKKKFQYSKTFIICQAWVRKMEKAGAESYFWRFRPDLLAEIFSMGLKWGLQIILKYASVFTLIFICTL